MPAFYKDFNMTDIDRSDRNRKVLILYILLAQEAFTAIRNLSGKHSGCLSPEDAVRHFDLAGQLAEALHNLPERVNDKSGIAYTQRSMERFVLSYPCFSEQYRFSEYLDKIRKLIPDIDDQ